jgi:hypothetical protein
MVANSLLPPPYSFSHFPVVKLSSAFLQVAEDSPHEEWEVVVQISFVPG